MLTFSWAARKRRSKVSDLTKELEAALAALKARMDAGDTRGQHTAQKKATAARHALMRAELGRPN